MGLFYTKQLRDFWQTTFPTIVGVGTRMQFIIKSEILDGRLSCKWERKKKNQDASLIAGCHCSLGNCWSKCSWSHVNPTLYCTELLNIKTCQAKYIVRNVSWWTWTALASAWWSLPLLWPEVWLPSALKEKGGWGGRGEKKKKKKEVGEEEKPYLICLSLHRMFS